MELVEIKNAVNIIEKEIFENSFQINISLEKLVAVYSNLIAIRNKFLETDFMEIQQEELEEIRYKINENILNIKICILEKRGLNIDLKIIRVEKPLNL